MMGMCLPPTTTKKTPKFFFEKRYCKYCKFVFFPLCALKYGQTTFKTFKQKRKKGYCTKFT